MRGRTLEKIYADGTKVTFAYDPYSGRLLSKTDALNQTTFFTYFADDSPFQTEYLNAVNPTSTVSTFYDQKFNRVSSVQSDWGITSYTYNSYITNPANPPITGGGALQLIHNNVIANSDITFQYDALGSVTNRNINGASNASSWVFDAISRVTSETNALGTFNYTYVDDTAGSSKGVSRLASVSYPNGQSTLFDWYGNTNDNRLRGITHMAPGSIPRSQFNYAHNAGGEIIRWAQQNAGLTPQISAVDYDKVSQLTGSVAGDGSASAPYSNQYFYGYDPASNRTGVQTVTVDTARIGGTVTTGNTLTITVRNSALTGGQKAINYVVVAGDTLSTIAGKLAANITADADMQAIGVNAVANSAVISIKSVASGVTTYTPSTSGGATETITTGVSKNAVQNATIGGTVTTGNMVTLTIYDATLAGGNTAISYTVTAGNTLANIASGLATNINADAGLAAAGITATSASTTVNIKSLSANLTTYKGSVNSGGTETVSLAMNMNGTDVIVIGGTKTTSDVLTVNIFDQGLTGGKRAISYTVLAGDTLATITTALAAAINADTQLQGIGVSASASGTQLTIKSVSVNTTSYTTARSSTATETITPSINANGTQTAVIGGTKTTGNILTITVFDLGLTGGSKAVNYTVLSGDTLTTIATGIAAAINADSSLSAIGVTASSVNTVVNIKSTSIHSTSYTQSVSAGSTETITLSKNIGVTMSAHNNVNQTTNISAGGATRFVGNTNKALKSTTISSQAIVLSAKAASLSSFSSSLAGVPQVTCTIDASNQRVDGTTSLTFAGTPIPGNIVNATVRNPNLPGGQQVISYTVRSGDTLSNIAYGIATAITANQFLYAASFSAYTSGNAAIMQSPPGSFYATSSAYSCSITGVPTESLTLASNVNGSTAATVGGTVTTGDVVSLVIANEKLPGGSQTVSRTVVGGDTTATIASALSTSINGNFSLAAIGMTASPASSVVNITTTGTTYSSSLSGGSTETITLGYNSQGNIVAAIGGVKKTGDVLTITTINPSLPGGQQAVSYTVLAGDTLVSIAAGLATAMNANANLQTLGVTATSSSTATLNWSTYYSGNAILPSGASTALTTATDGANNTKSDTTQPVVNNPASQTLTFDLNGNMTSDGTNSYKWDAANRLIEIDYAGINNFTSFTYDGSWRNTKIVETTSGSVTSTKQFVWCVDDMRTEQPCEERDGSGALVKAFFARGQLNSSTKYFYTRDHLGISSNPASKSLDEMDSHKLLKVFDPKFQVLENSVGHKRIRMTYPEAQFGSVRELVDNSGAIQAQYSYDTFGRTTKVFEAVASDFQYGGYYLHARSGLNVTHYREYSSSLGRWISRDPIEESGGFNLFGYVKNNPISKIDPSGLDDDGWDEKYFTCAAKCAAQCAFDSDPFGCFRKCYFDCVFAFPGGPPGRCPPPKSPGPGSPGSAGS